MKSARQDLPVEAEMSEGTIRQVTWGSMTVEAGVVRQAIDTAPLFRGLPDDRCQCPHWGYVIKGRMRCRFADHEEVFSAGDVYYVPPGHTFAFEAGCEYVEFSPAEEYRRTMEVVERNAQAMQ